MVPEKVYSSLMREKELFSTLLSEELDFILENSGMISLPKKAPLFSSGEKASRFYILTEGEIRVFKKNEAGNEEEMAHFTSGDAIGDFDFARDAEYDANAEAEQDSLLIVFPAVGLSMDMLAREEPGIICRILFNAIIMMTARIKAANKLVLDRMSWVQDLHRRAYEDAGTGLWKQTLITDEIKGSLKDPSALIMLKPDRFKILVDSCGHTIGDEAMIRIALILKNITRGMGHGWALRFKSNEVGLIFNECDALQAEKIVNSLVKKISSMEPVLLRPPGSVEEAQEFHFSATISWCIWPADGENWNNLYHGNYANLLDTWKASGDTAVHYKFPEET
ncbi:MAG: cyclic nucleotide-binding domain-containing protein [Treponema sp.]|nr:cyclic nucleotide-binding domain-containing protein [Treponema sp.]